MSKCSRSYNSWSYIFPEGSFLRILCAQFNDISVISHPDSSIIVFTEFLTSSADSFYCDRMPVNFTHNLLTYCSFSSEEYFVLLLQVFHKLLKNWFSGRAHAAFINFLLKNKSK